MGAREFEGEMSRWAMDDTRFGLEPPAASALPETDPRLASQNHSRKSLLDLFEAQGGASSLSLGDASRKVRSLSAEPYDDLCEPPSGLPSIGSKVRYAGP